MRQIPFSVEEYSTHAMDLFRKESLNVDTRAPPTTPSHLTTSVLLDLLVGEQDTSLGSDHTTTQDSGNTGSKAQTTALPASTTVGKLDSSALAHTEHLSSLSGSAVLGIILGGLAAVVFLLFILLLCIKRSKKKHNEKKSLAQALEMHDGTPKENEKRRTTKARAAIGN
jgi:hypothetical protein